MEFRLAKPIDKNELEKIYDAGSKKLKDEGINQWQGPDKPNTDKLEELISNKEIYVLEDEGKVVSTAIILDYDEDYENNLYGNWISNGSYFSIHRVGTINSKRRHGYGSKVIECCENYGRENNINSIRIDTHRENIAMQSLLKKLGYNYCGLVYLKGKDERFAFEKIL